MSSFDHLPLQIGDSLVLLQDMEFVDAEGDIFTVDEGAVFEVDSTDWNNGYYRDYGYHAVCKTENKETWICVKHADFGTKYKKYLPIREEVLWFAEQMEAKLKENDHKEGWNGCGIFWLKNRLIEEVNELSDAMDAGHNSESGLDVENIIREAADVANFAMMIADKAKKRLA
ncbi:hypothetical protein [Brevibacillus brevis]|uniref:hypothetical protein n=1 Tax=Brevibacillus brevis TaxID=1393 RepID=UPI001F5BE6B8|nr:hypothetical protein [Brevibacillus brevis]